ncbi:MAG: alanine--glyoxylate aminotransferase family protein [Pseudobdellovibrio sp.]|nr:alanine--glyoxylate aminotransferase family protein [Pseudobdellovibrio sp.]
MSIDTSKSLLLAPGPVQLHPEVQKILSLPMIHHRTPEFDSILKTVLSDLKTLFVTKEKVFILSSTGSGGMEALLINVIRPKAKVLAIISGKFGERWAEMAEIFGAEVHKINVPWGSAANVSDVEKFLKENPDTEIVMSQACETSTATVHPIKEIAEVVAKTKAVFLVDAITALGAMPLPMDEWQIDGLVAGSQKAIMLPTGLSLVSFSQKAWAKIKDNPTPRYYFDIRKELAANDKGETFFSSNVALIRALDFVLKDIKSTGLEGLFKTIQRRAFYTRAMASVLGLEVYSKNPSDSVTALLLPPGFDGAKLREHLEKSYNVTVMGGQDQLKGKIIRLGHMGYITDQDLHQTTERLAAGLNDFGFSLDLQKVSDSSLHWLKEHR